MCPFDKDTTEYPTTAAAEENKDGHAESSLWKIEKSQKSALT